MSEGGQGFGALFERLEDQLVRMEADAKTAIRQQAETSAKLDTLAERVGGMDDRLRDVEKSVTRQDGAKEGGGGAFSRGLQILQGLGVLAALLVALWARCPGG